MIAKVMITNEHDISNINNWTKQVIPFTQQLYLWNNSENILFYERIFTEIISCIFF